MNMNDKYKGLHLVAKQSKASSAPCLHAQYEINLVIYDKRDSSWTTKCLERGELDSFVRDKGIEVADIVDDPHKSLATERAWRRLLEEIGDDLIGVANSY